MFLQAMMKLMIRLYLAILIFILLKSFFSVLSLLFFMLCLTLNSYDVIGLDRYIVGFSLSSSMKYLAI
jgi:hypothetical protein